MNKNHKEYIKGLQEKIQEYIKNKVNDENIEIKYSDFETIIHDVNIDYKIENKSCCYCDPKAYPLEEAKKAKAQNIKINVIGVTETPNEKLKLIAEALLEYETLTKEQIDYLVENGKMPEEDDTKLESLSITKLRKLAEEKGIKDFDKKSKAELLKELDETL